jgi:hypothetical protein
MTDSKLMINLVKTTILALKPVFVLEECVSVLILFVVVSVEMEQKQRYSYQLIGVTTSKISSTERRM